MRQENVVTCFLLRRSGDDDEILLLRRSQQVGTYRGRWAGVSGYIEEADPLLQAYTEVEEETGLAREDVQLLRTGEPLEVVDAEADRTWIVHPFLFEVREPARIRSDWEHIESRWIRPEEIFQYETVPQLAETLMRVYSLRQP
ncbi:MAG: NUDIX pyrophosphatase [Dehalococcoidia bacterium]|nr:MAG: NUDIX pyrophosphatase [Dehalococcoidia bacterium]